MVLDFVGALATGFGLMGLVLLINRLTGNRLERWIYPATVALGMVGYTVWAEYTWPSRTIGSQPNLRLASQNGESLFYRPWTYVWPQVTRMVAVDLSRTQVHPQQPDRVLTQIVLIGRWQPVRVVGAVFDCAAHARADLGDGAIFNDDGSIDGVEWRPLEEEDAVLRTVCAAGEEIRNGRGNGA
ncbi:MAG: hypothetical protein Kow0013_21190 [Pararhodobacter sp.]